MSQVLAISSWSLISEHSVAKGIHFIFQITAVSFLIAGLLAIVKYQFQRKAPSLTTMHSWLGVLTVAVFGCNFSVGITMGIVKQFYSETKVGKAFDFSSIHRLLGLFTFFLTVISIVTGIMNHLGLGKCYYYDSNDVIYKADVNPADNYRYLPDACKIANGMGIATIASAFIIGVAVYVRSQNGSGMSIQSPSNIQLRDISQA